MYACARLSNKLKIYKEEEATKKGYKPLKERMEEEEEEEETRAREEGQKSNVAREKRWNQERKEGGGEEYRGREGGWKRKDEGVSAAEGEIAVD